MGIAEDWADLMFNLDCLSKGAAKRKFRKSIKYGWGGLCAYCRCNRATSLDHIKPRSKGGSSLRSNLIPCCTSCNHSKGSQPWLEWFKQQLFYNETAKELIEEWITNKRFIEEELDEQPVEHRATVRLTKSTLRSNENEQASSGKDCLAAA
tara:strand:- start:1000 stop:1452 length:453 start_codon:yes stop_codon:yes gene_type:complete